MTTCHDKTIWYIQNNGADGDNWSYNNVGTGGAGAIGWMLETLHNTDPDEVPNMIKNLESAYDLYATNNERI